MANSYTSLTQGAGAGPNQGPREVHRWTFDANGIGDYVKIAGGTVSWGPVDPATFGSGTIVLRVSFSGLTDLKKPASGNSMIVGDSSIAGSTSTDGMKTAILPPCLIAPELTSATTPTIIIEAAVLTSR